jgi:hypothetical protein
LLTYSRLKYLYLAYFSKPVGDRKLYRSVRRHPVHRILEIGMGPAARTLRLIDTVHRQSAGQEVRYVAIDLFEARPKETAGLSLKETHRLLKTTAAQVQLIPGDPASALARAANALQKIDLVLISCEHTEQSLDRAWFYLPRMLHEGSEVYLESHAAQGPGTQWRLLSVREIESQAAAHRPRRAA